MTKQKLLTFSAMLHQHLLLFLAQLPVVAYTTSIPIAEGQKLSDYLWTQTAKYQNQALNTNLIKGMKEKCLDPSEFGAYMLDDIIYLYENSKNWAIAGARAAENNVTLQTFLEAEAESWKGYWEDYQEAWHIASADGIKMREAVANYVTHIRNVAENEELAPAYTIVALTPCAKLWPWIGGQIGSGINNFGVYTSWVESNFNPNSTGYLEYEAHVQWAHEQNIVTADKSLEIFSASMQNEVSFFNSVARCTSSAMSVTSKGTNGMILAFAFFSTVTRMTFND